MSAKDCKCPINAARFMGLYMFAVGLNAGIAALNTIEDRWWLVAASMLLSFWSGYFACGNYETLMNSLKRP